MQGEDRSGFEAALAAARAADLCVAVVGDLAGLFGHGSSGEGCDAEDLRLPGVQAELLDELLQVGTPVVVVVVSGRPYALGEVPAAPPAWCRRSCPRGGASAIAGGLSGRSSRAGAPVQIPKRPGGQPGTYLQPPASAVPRAPASQRWTDPPIPFGYAASYTTFTVDAIRIGEAEVPTDGAFTVAVRVRNTGPREGYEGSSSTSRDVLAQVARPVKQLAGFARVGLAARGGCRGDLPRPRRPDRYTTGGSSDR